ncbi:MAG TPA: hypothetical protein VK601_07600 [Kofleriaceae bacterium]|nr:hypothetical protein [Kofleriaceae bacterium]
MTLEPLRRSRRWNALAVALVLAGTACGKPEHAGLRWGIGVAVFDATALGLARARTPDPFVDAIRPGRLRIPTYDGSNQATHPDVVIERDGAGVRVAMAMTPYPFSDRRLENPSLVVSRDGMAFDPAPGAPAPLVPAPAYDHNNDPDLRRDPRTGDYELLYLETLRPDRQVLVALRSPDLRTWTRRDAVVYDFHQPDQPFMVSPAAIDDAGVTHLYYVDTVTSRLYAMTSSDGTWDPRAAAPVAIELGVVVPWHVDAIRGEAGFGLLISGYDTAFEHQDLYLATSPDLVTWTLRPAPLLAHRDPALGVASLYRSTGVVEHGSLIVWYAMQYP